MTTTARADLNGRGDTPPNSPARESLRPPAQSAFSAAWVDGGTGRVKSPGYPPTTRVPKSIGPGFWGSATPERRKDPRPVRASMKYLWPTISAGSVKRPWPSVKTLLKAKPDVKLCRSSRFWILIPHSSSCLAAGKPNSSYMSRPVAEAVGDRFKTTSGSSGPRSPRGPRRNDHRRLRPPRLLSALC